MKTFIVTLRATGGVVHRYEAEAAVEWSGMEFATHEHAELSEQPAESPAQTGPRRLTKLQFIGRLEPAEFTGLLDMARVNTEVEKFLKLIDWTTPDPDGTSIDLDDPRTVAGVRGLFPAERADQILGASA